LVVGLGRAFGLLEPTSSRLWVIEFAREPVRGFEITTLGLLNLAQLAAHPPPTALTEDQLAELDAAWSAITATTPGPLLRVLSKSSAALPFLRSSLRSLFDRFLYVQTRLTRW